MKKVEVKVAGTVSGYTRNKYETVEHAQARLVLEAEIAANADCSRRVILQMAQDEGTHCDHGVPLINLCEHCAEAGGGIP